MIAKSHLRLGRLFSLPALKGFGDEASTDECVVFGSLFPPCAPVPYIPSKSKSDLGTESLGNP